MRQASVEPHGGPVRFGGLVRNQIRRMGPLRGARSIRHGGWASPVRTIAAASPGSGWLGNGNIVTAGWGRRDERARPMANEAPAGALRVRSIVCRSRAEVQGLIRSRVAYRSTTRLPASKPARERALEPDGSCGVVARRPRPSDRVRAGLRVRRRHTRRRAAPERKQTGIDGNGRAQARPHDGEGQGPLSRATLGFNLPRVALCAVRMPRIVRRGGVSRCRVCQHL